MSSNVKSSGALNAEARMALNTSRGGFTILIASQIVPFVMLVNLRYILAEAYVSPSLDQATGAVFTILFVISAITAYAGLQATNRSDSKASARMSVLTMVLGWIALIMMGYQFWEHAFQTDGRFGEGYLVTIGAFAIYFIASLIGLLSGKMRASRVGIDDSNRFSIGATFKFWIFLQLMWVVLYVVYYFI
ncbi:cytochrome c oxidase subunit 3 [Ferroacidibacillus organovorans]|uniref:Heme-copper oxidase subunit III family profile domain-containing protein n=1 Tax=Ferroacidibacillus organovorans TaxID=1765683 RepID=A0A101XSA7_9BACL|nr:cytochrome c oxidase subunit 3 [Ferroacidibacillus organovorans]KUO96642.1 hypothetical protein ATW55_07365 [Ferroacidibacillus organovorans]